MEPFVKIFKKIAEWEWYQDSRMVHLFLHLIICANYTNRQWHGITVERGQYVTSRHRLHEDTGLSEKEIRTCLKRLQKTGEILIKSTNKFSVITITKYDEYQRDSSKFGQQKANERPTKGQRKATIKEEKNKYIESSLRSDSLSPQAATSQECVVNALGFLDFFNGSIQSTPGCVIPTITQIDRRRMGMLNARSKEYGKEALATVVRKAVASSYLNYGTGQFTASFDWIFRPTNFRKILEGNFDNKVFNQSNTSQNGYNDPDHPTNAQMFENTRRIVARMQAEEDAGPREVRI